MVSKPDYDVYAEQLQCLNYGYPIYDPDPDPSSGNGIDRVRPGDVGHIFYGTFIREFNIFFPKEHSINDEVLEDFEQLHITKKNIRQRSRIPPQVFRSKGVKDIGFSLDISGTAVENGINVKLECCREQGAALLIYKEAIPQDVLNRDAMRKHILKHYECWHKFIKETRGRDVKLSDIILVTGCDMTADWVTTAFPSFPTQVNGQKAEHKKKAKNIKGEGKDVEIPDFDVRSVDAEISLRLGYPMVASAELSFWARVESSKSTTYRKGPQAKPKTNDISDSSTASTSRLDDSTDPFKLPEESFNQCIFIRGYRVATRLGMRRLEDIEMKAAAGYDILPGRDDIDPSPGSVVAVEETEEEIDKNVYDIALNYILEQSDADVALVHDEDLYPFTKRMNNLNDFKLSLKNSIISTEVNEDNVSFGYIYVHTFARGSKESLALEDASATLNQQPTGDKAGKGEKLPSVGSLPTSTLFPKYSTRKPTTPSKSIFDILRRTNLMETDYDVYANQMKYLKCGYALYHPYKQDPDDQIRPGDVGCMHKGSFERVFNIFYEKAHPFNFMGVPDNFERFNGPVPDARKSTIPNQIFHSNSINIASSSFDSKPMTVKLRCRKNVGAALILQDDIVREDISSRAMKNYMLEHYKSWHKFIRENSGLDIQPSDIILVTGCDTTSSKWATVAFNNCEIGTDFSFRPNAAAATDYPKPSFWEGSGEFRNGIAVRCGVMESPSFDYCVFIRGFRVQKRFFRQILNII